MIREAAFCEIGGQSINVGLEPVLVHFGGQHLYEQYVPYLLLNY